MSSRDLYKPYEEAREISRQLGLKSSLEWIAWVKDGNKPTDIPSSPATYYKKRGWKGWGDWLGTGTVSSKQKKFRPFKEAREFVRKLGLNGQADWRTWVKSPNRPQDIPTAPNRIYEKDGWISWGDWFGTNRVAHVGRRYRTYEEAREYARSLGLRTCNEWQTWIKQNGRPVDIPWEPARYYRGKGWIDWKDWLGVKVDSLGRAVLRPEEGRV